MSVHAGAQSYLKKYNSDVTLGLMGGSLDYREEFKQFTFGFNLAICGLYFDFGCNPKSHTDDWKQGKVGAWKDGYNVFVHAGYQVPLGRYLKVTPIIGYYYHSIGVSQTETYIATDGTIRVRNSYEGDERYKGFDYGAQAQINIPISKSVWLCPQGMYTKNIWTVGLGLVIPISDN